MDRERPKVLLNATTIVKGGGIQAVVSFICSLAETRAVDSLDWYLAVSGSVKEQLDGLDVALSERDLVFEISPAKSSGAGKKLLDYVIGNDIGCVFTFFGPAYVRFPVTHICGVADGWVTHSDWEAFSKISSAIKKIRMFLLCCYKGVWFRKADAWFVEQEAAMAGLARRLRIDSHKVHVIGNNCGNHYAEFVGEPLLLEPKDRILVFASFYPNKNIESVPFVAKALVDSGRPDIEFVLTIDPQEAGFDRVLKTAQQLGVDSNINNIGAVDIADGPSLYRSCKILLMPSVLETFSAVYPEAMMMGLPIVTADKTFSRAICGNAASYYDSQQPKSAAAEITKLLDDTGLYQDLVDKGKIRLTEFPDADQKFDLLHQMVEKYAR